ncbi:MAG: hypothetical protein ACKVP3_09555 [Hyphomicrobiaceae bacterium]
MSSLVAAFLAYPLVLLLGGKLEWTDPKYAAIWVTAWAAMLFLVVSPFRMWRAQREEIKALKADLAAVRARDEAALKNPASKPAMTMRELAVHMHGRVRRFAEIDDWERRYTNVDAAVRDALSLGHLNATGRPVDWLDKMTSHLTTRTEIKAADFWKKRGAIDWSSVGREDEFKKDTATQNGDAHFYAVEFDRANALSLWPEDFDEPVGIAQLGEIAEMCLGYDYHTRRSHTLSLIGGIREAAGQKKLEMVGRFGCFYRDDDPAHVYPLIPISAEHFHEYWLQVTGHFKGTRNWEVHTYTLGNDDWVRNCYRDIHCANRRQALDWLLAFRPKRLEPKDEGNEEGKEATSEGGSDCGPPSDGQGKV